MADGDAEDLPWSEEDVAVRRARIRPGPGDVDDDQDDSLVTDGGREPLPDSWDDLDADPPPNLPDRITPRILDDAVRDHETLLEVTDSVRSSRENVGRALSRLGLREELESFDARLVTDGGHSTEIVDGAPDGYPPCGGCGYVFEHDDELTEHECDPVTDGGQRTVYVKGNGHCRGKPLVLHLSPDCQRLASAKNVFEKARDVFLDDARICQFCSGTFEPGGGDPRGTWNRLEEMEPDELLTDGGVDTVYRVNSRGNGGPRIHRDPECRHIKASESEAVERPASAFPDWVPRCSRCWNDGERVIVTDGGKRPPVRVVRPDGVTVGVNPVVAVILLAAIAVVSGLIVLKAVFLP